MIVLGIESTCDETAAAVVRDGREVLAPCVASSADVHERYGGVFPELACRRHIDAIVPVIEGALEKAGVGPEEIRKPEVFYRYLPKDIKLPLPDGYYGHLHNIYIHYGAECGVPAALALTAARARAPRCPPGTRNRAGTGRTLARTATRARRRSLRCTRARTPARRGARGRMEDGKLRRSTGRQHSR